VLLTGLPPLGAEDGLRLDLLEVQLVEDGQERESALQVRRQEIHPLRRQSEIHHATDARHDLLVNLVAHGADPPSGTTLPDDMFCSLR
jgi:hypothetical protein